MDTSAQSSVPVQPGAMSQPLMQQTQQQPVSVQQQVVQGVLTPEPEMLTDATQASAQALSQPAVQPISLPHREAGPGSGRMTEFIQPTHVEPNVPTEVREAGVEVSPNVEQPKIPADVAQMGVQPAKAAVPVAQMTGASIQYITDAPFTDVQAVQIEKSRRASESIRWLATFLLKQIKKLTLLGGKNGSNR